MTNPETCGETKSPEQTYIDHAKLSLELFHEAEILSEPDNMILFRAEQAAESVIHTSVYDGLGFRLRIIIPSDQDITAETSKIWDPQAVIPPHEFIADEIQRINSVQIDFYNREDKEYLVVYTNKHKLEIQSIPPTTNLESPK